MNENQINNAVRAFAVISIAISAVQIVKSIRFSRKMKKPEQTSMVEDALTRFLQPPVGFTVTDENLRKWLG